MSFLFLASQFIKLVSAVSERAIISGHGMLLHAAVLIVITC